MTAPNRTATKAGRAVRSPRPVTRRTDHRAQPARRAAALRTARGGRCRMGAVDNVATPGPTPGAPRGGGSRHTAEQAAVPAGTFAMGDALGDGHPADGETPVHEVALSAYSIDATTVTVADFAAFVAQTGHVTEAESFGYSAVFHLALTAPEHDVLGSPRATPWWLGVRGAQWRHPGGAGSDVADVGDHPVTHVSHVDALAYCAWASRALPTEAQWERAARGTLVGARYPWGDELRAGDGAWRCNIWQGRFPTENTLADGYLTTAPVRSYGPNSLGLWQCVGNVWEWCADWFDPRCYGSSPARDPRGPASGTARVMRGGSYLCHDSYCNRYRVAARSSNTPDSSASNVGFRTVSPPG